MKSRKLTLAGILILAVFSLAIVGVWLNGWLYLRLPAAKITLNGKATEGSKIYKGASGNYFVFLENESAEFPVYAASSLHPEVGIPASLVPSGYTKSVKTNWFLFCGHCPLTMAGSDKFDRNATVSVTSDGLTFKVEGDEVAVKF